MVVLYFIIIALVFLGGMISLKENKGDLSQAITDHLKNDGYIGVKSIKKLGWLEYSRCPYASKMVRPAVRVGSTFVSKNDVKIRKVVALNAKEELEELWVLIEVGMFSGKRKVECKKTGRFK